MAELTFGERYEQDTNFKEAVDQFRHELVLVAFGVDPEQLLAAWDGKRLNIDAADFGGYGPSAVTAEFVADGWQEEEVVDNPAADVSAEEAKDLIGQLEDDGDVSSIEAIRDQDERVTVVLEAARVLFDIRMEE